MNPPNSRSRWASIADELGLTSEPEPVPPPPPPAVAKAAVPAPAAPIPELAPEVEPEAEPARGRKRRGAVEEPVVEPAAPETSMEAPAPEAPTVAEESGEPLPTEGAESTPPQDERRRGRRRGRRGRGRRDTEETEPAKAGPVESDATAAEVAETPIGEETPLSTVAEAGAEPTTGAEKPKDKERSRRRGRGRTRKGSNPDAEGAEDAEKETTVAETIATEPEAPDDGESEDVSGWEVPSWNELIAALYRPDR